MIKLLSVASVGILYSTLFFMLGFDPVWVCTGLVHAVTVAKFACSASLIDLDIVSVVIHLPLLALHSS